MRDSLAARATLLFQMESALKRRGGVQDVAFAYALLAAQAATLSPS